MAVVSRVFTVFGLCALLAGCGSNTTPPASTNPYGPAVALPGSTTVVTCTALVMVPPDTIVATPNGNTLTLSGTNNYAVHTSAGAVITVPATATGPAKNVVYCAEYAGADTYVPATITVLAGGANTRISNTPLTDGTGQAAVLWGRGHILVDKNGDLIISDASSLKKVTQAGVVTTLGPFAEVGFNGIAMDASGNIFSSWGSYQDESRMTIAASIFALTATNTVVPIAVNWKSGPAATSDYYGAGGLAVDADHNLYYADQVAGQIVKFTLAGVKSVFAGSGAAGTLDGKGSEATFNFPNDIAIDASGNLFVTDANTCAVRKITPDGTVTTIAKRPLQYGCTAIAVDTKGNVYASGTNLINRIDANGKVSIISLPDPANGNISGMATDAEGNLYVNMWGNGAQVLKMSFK